ncbi:unnamed protein product [Adineta steineri]|uniref:Uncharacterized protein n=1 Tax=Adineta steineri TaxID=433720 RepID=A0A815EMZ6_9BILA|nr:unnamed protein product [Adineta steineri]CAF1581461.1 unnamed protein product [Adineta steineri]
MWTHEIDNIISTDLNKLLVGNKCDLIAERVVDYAQAKVYLADSLSMPYVETSAKNASNVQEEFKAKINYLISTTSGIPIEISDINAKSSIKPLDTTIETNAEDNRIFKLVLLGDSGVGKTSLFLRFANDAFNDIFLPTVGVDFWDTAGQERFRSLISSHYRNAKGAFVVFDVTNLKSFENVTRWLQEINENSNNDLKTLLVGNKCDLTLKRVVDHAQAKNLADSLNILYVETSAKNTTNVELAFMSLISEIMPNQSSVKTDDTSIEIGSQQK